jgi:hypothetical protein
MFRYVIDERFKKMFMALMAQLKLYDVEVSAYRLLIEQLKKNASDIPWGKMLKDIRNTKRFRQQEIRRDRGKIS